nr:adenylyltransferase and sulfurtransferase [Hymenolepis microstoma]
MLSYLVFLDKFNNFYFLDFVFLCFPTFLPFFLYFLNSLMREKCDLSKEDVLRYSRQLLIPDFGPSKQVKLRDARVLVVGCGGLGCPVGIYLASCGVGHITLVDDDIVEVANLHRQVMHTEASVGRPKVESLRESMRSVNSTVEIDAKNLHLTNLNACEIVENHDLVLDCTDNVATRYLLNDACAACGPIPLVSGSALRYEGQMTVYLTAHLQRGFSHEAKRQKMIEEERIPCFRCLNPSPPPAVQACSDAGVLGVVPGIIGIHQVSEAIKILSGIGESIAGNLFIFDLERNVTRKITLRKSRLDCPTCSPANRITREKVKATNYVYFCGAPSSDKPRSANKQLCNTRLSVQELKALRDSSVPHLLIDIRSPVEVEICRLNKCLYIPLKELYREANLELVRDKIKSAYAKTPETPYLVILLCRRGNTSNANVRQYEEALKRILKASDSTADLLAVENGDTGTEIPITVKDVAGGLQAWSEMDDNFPIY